MGRSSYSDAVGWLKAARPKRIDVDRFAWAAFFGSLVMGLAFLGLLALLSPERFGRFAARPLSTGIRGWILVGLVAASVLYVLIRARRGMWLFTRVTEPFRRSLDNEYGFEGVAGALEQCSPPQRQRFAWQWVWMPAALTVAGVTFAFSAAYFAIDAASRINVGLGQAIFGVGNCLLSVLAFRLGAKRLATWRIATSAYRDATRAYR